MMLPEIVYNRRSRKAQHLQSVGPAPPQGPSGSQWDWKRSWPRARRPEEEALRERLSWLRVEGQRLRGRPGVLDQVAT